MVGGIGGDGDGGVGVRLWWGASVLAIACARGGARRDAALRVV